LLDSGLLVLYTV